jgi:hypothetical protein
MVLNVDNFYRHFEVPGLGHCFGGYSGSPTTLFNLLRAWVENGAAPESASVEVTGLDGEVQQRSLCPYPQTAEPTASATCGVAETDCWSCGAMRVERDYPADADYVVLADPDWNRFCVVSKGV